MGVYALAWFIWDFHMTDETADLIHTILPFLLHLHGSTECLVSLLNATQLFNAGNNMLWVSDKMQITEGTTHIITLSMCYMWMTHATTPKWEAKPADSTLFPHSRTNCSSATFSWSRNYHTHTMKSIKFWIESLLSKASMKDFVHIGFYHSHRQIAKKTLSKTCKLCTINSNWKDKLQL